MSYFNVNIGIPPSDAWWARNQREAIITAGYDAAEGDKGERGLQRLSAGDTVFAYAKGYGFVGIGTVLGPETYQLLQPGQLPPDYEIKEHRHQRGVRWTNCARVLIDAVKPSNRLGRRAPRGNPIQQISDLAAAEETAKTLRERLPPYAATPRPRNVTPASTPVEPVAAPSTDPQAEALDTDNSIAALEGIGREQLLVNRSRNRNLRDAKLRGSGGTCECCEVNFTNLLSGRGLRALQVHHLKQRSLSEEPQLNSLNDLAVVCGNCHLMIHSDPRSAMPIAELKALWAEFRKPSRGDA